MTARRSTDCVPGASDGSPGQAALAVEVVAGASTITSATATSPLKLLTPMARGKSVWACLSSFGGGLVAGDETQLRLRIGSQARCFVTTQASTKVYRNPEGRPCGHRTLAHVEPEALLIFAPDPVQPFAGSQYHQRQEVHLAETASLVWVDSVTSGRFACGERWAFAHYESRTQVLRDGRPVFLEATRLHPADGPLTARHRLGRFNCLALLLLLGPGVRDVAQVALRAVAELPVSRRPSLLISASPLADGAVLRFAGESVEEVGRALRQHLAELRSLLGDDPWHRKW